MATDFDELEMSQEEALWIADGVAHRPDGTSQALARLDRDLRKAQARVAALGACFEIVPLEGMVYDP
ncbi:MAG: hypothetical protein HY922_01875 [Elusimicrobia bacterium]|nr:hypothetical protein [Elusimicrobiota bacterium]